MSHVMCALEAERLMIEVRSSFRRINDDEGLTEADKKQPKDFYLQHMIAPNACKLLEKHVPNELRGNSGPHHRMTPADRRRREAMRSASPNPNTQAANPRPFAYPRESAKKSLTQSEPGKTIPPAWGGTIAAFHLPRKQGPQSRPNGPSCRHDNAR